MRDLRKVLCPQQVMEYVYHLGKYKSYQLFLQREYEDLVEEGSEDQKNTEGPIEVTRRECSSSQGWEAKPRAQMVTTYKHERWGAQGRTQASEKGALVSLMGTQYGRTFHVGDM